MGLWSHPFGFLGARVAPNSHNGFERSCRCRSRGLHTEYKTYNYIKRRSCRTKDFEEKTGHRLHTVYKMYNYIKRTVMQDQRLWGEDRSFSQNSSENDRLGEVSWAVSQNVRALQIGKRVHRNNNVGSLFPLAPRPSLVVGGCAIRGGGGCQR